MVRAFITCSVMVLLSTLNVPATQAQSDCRPLADDALVRVDFAKIGVRPLADMFSCATGRVIVVGDDVPTLTVDLSHPEPVRVEQAYAAFLHTLFVHGLEVTRHGRLHLVRRIVV